MSDWKCLVCQAAANPLSSADRCFECGGVLTATVTASAARSMASDIHKYQFTGERRFSIPDLFPVTADTLAGAAGTINFGKPAASASPASSGDSPPTHRCRRCGAWLVCTGPIRCVSPCDGKLELVGSSSYSVWSPVSTSPVAKALDDEASELETLRAENSHLVADNGTLRSIIASLDRKVDAMRRQLAGDPSSSATKSDVCAERDSLRKRVEELSGDLAWHKRELARARGKR